jgi:hypothetical protein
MDPYIIGYTNFWHTTNPFYSGPVIKGHTISDSLETLQALSIENNTIGDPLSLTH